MNSVISTRDFACPLDHVKQRINWWPVLGLALDLVPWAILAWVIWR